MNHEEREVSVQVGLIPMEVLMDWASPRLKAVIYDESRTKEAAASVLALVKERGLPDKYLEQLESEFIEEQIKEMLLVTFARASVEMYFQRKTEAEIESETLDNPEWVTRTTEETVNEFANNIIQAANEWEMLKFVENLFGVGVEKDETGENQ